MGKALTGYLKDAGIENVAGVILKGGVAVLPTDTIYGFHCLAFDAVALCRVRNLKGRGTSAGFVVLASSMSMVDSMVSWWRPEYREKLDSIWPERMTAVLPAARDADAIFGRSGTLAVRIPAFDELRKLIDRIGSPIISTSVNRTGEPPLTQIDAIKSAFPDLEAYISQRGRSSRRPSTLVDFTAAEPVVIRYGAYPWR